MVKRALVVLSVLVVIVAACDDDQPAAVGGAGSPPATTVTVSGSDAIQPEFEWSMPARFGLDANEDGRIDVPNTFEYAHNLAPGSCPDGCPPAAPTFTVNLSGSGSTSQLGPIEEYRWEIRFGSELVAETASAEAGAVTRLPEGRYRVSLTVVVGAETATVTQQVDVRDHLIVAIGDSYASGEGNPETRRIDSSGSLPRTIGVWADDGGDGGGPVVERHHRAHRSTLAAAPQAALRIEEADEHSSVTLLFVPASGAEIGRGLLGPQSDVPHDDSNDIELPPQVDAIATMLGCTTTDAGPRCDRTIDALTITIGGNDAGFSTVIGGLVIADPDIGFQRLYDFAVDEILDVAEAGIRDLAGQYASLDELIRARLQVETIYLVAYPSAVGLGAQLCDVVADDLVPGLEVDGDEIIQTVERVVVPLGEAMAAAAAEHGWVYVDGHLDDFAAHGYCGSDPYPAAEYPGNPFPEPVTDSPEPTARWFRQADESAVIQGTERDTFRPADLATSGTLHPNEFGHLSMRDALLAVIELQ